jgi:hypothetical protein
MLYIPPKRLWPDTQRAKCSAQPRNAERAYSLDVRYDISTILPPHSQRNAKLVAVRRHYFVTKFKRVADRGRPQPYLCVLAHSKKAKGSLCSAHGARATSPLLVVNRTFLGSECHWRLQLALFVKADSQLDSIVKRFGFWDASIRKRKRRLIGDFLDLLIQEMVEVAPISLQLLWCLDFRGCWIKATSPLPRC